MDHERKKMKSSINSDQFRVNVVKGEMEWIQVRKCLARSFHDYPLYKYLLPDLKTRLLFLGKFLEANYEVAVRQGKGVVLSVSVKKEQGAKNSYVIIGGCFFVPPDGNGGWDNAEDQVYFDSYIKQGMNEIDSVALQNIISYEKWESQNIFEKIKTPTLNTWILYFWGIDPDYSGLGYGSATHPYVKQALVKIHQSMFHTEDPGKEIIEQGGDHLGPDDGDTLYGDRNRGVLSKASKPIIAGLCHCERAEKFHKRHGFRTITTFPMTCRTLGEVGDCCENLKPKIRYMLLDLNGEEP